MTWSQGITVYLYPTMATGEFQKRSSVEQSSDVYVLTVMILLQTNAFLYRILCAMYVNDFMYIYF